jgi:hypothetical protein
MSRNDHLGLSLGRMPDRGKRLFQTEIIRHLPFGA